MVTKDGRPKILDFGLCKSMFGPTSPEDSAESIDGLIIGSPLFMAPEQASGKNTQVDGRCDVYSLGVIIYMTLLRRHPVVVSPDDRTAAIEEVAAGSVQPPTELNPRFSKSLEAILLKALARDPDDRYASAQEFGDAIRAFIANRKKQKSN